MYFTAELPNPFSSVTYSKYDETPIAFRVAYSFLLPCQPLLCVSL